MKNIIGMLKVGGFIVLFTCGPLVMMGLLAGCAVRFQHAMNVEMGEELPATSTTLGVEQEVTYIPKDAEAIPSPSPIPSPDIDTTGLFN